LAKEALPARRECRPEIPMSGSRSATRVPSYETFSDDVLLELAASPESLTEVACRELGMELQRRGIAEERVEACRAEAARIRTRQERWTKVRRLRFRDWLFFGLLCPLGGFAGLLILAVGVGFVGEKLAASQGDLAGYYVAAAQLVFILAYFAAVLWALHSGRAPRLMHHWTRRSGWRDLGRKNRRLKFHSYYCAARSRGTAAIFLGFSLLMLFFAHRDLDKPVPASRESLIILLALVYCIGLFADFFVSLSCVRERLVLGICIVEFTVMLLSAAVPALLAPYAHAIRVFAVALWIGALLVSLSLFRSAIHAPPPGVSRVER
jgi:hypothetical protein